MAGEVCFAEAYDRLRYFLPAENIYIISLARYLPAIAEELSQLPPENLIGEPVGRDTANAIALSAAILHEHDPDTIMGVFTADHAIRTTEMFAADVQRAFDAVAGHPDALVTFGIKPTEVHTGLGYIERGEQVSPGVYRVSSFREKPDAQTATGYLSSGRHYWNSGMFVWRTDAILRELQCRLPDTVASVAKLAQGWFSPEGAKLAAEVYPTLTRISIDFAVMEHAKNVLVVEGNFEWHDVGNWTALEKVLRSDEAGNVHAATYTSMTDSRGSIVVSEGDHLIATIGVENLIVVHSENATLVCHRDRI
ncbi:MAG: mannose-1-phosphate guanylyltransferase [Planctomycetes bacterium]|nr:mannose-1-phosphate guanylyltransferase [Planctomycetota bacterium]